MNTKRHSATDSSQPDRRLIARLSAVFVTALLGTLLTTAVQAQGTVLIYYPFNTNGIPGSGDAAFTNSYLETATIGSSRSTLTNYNAGSGLSFVNGTTLSAQPGVPAGNAVSDSLWVGNTNYFQFTFNATGYGSIIVNYDLARSNTGPVTNQFQYSTDGGTTYTVFADNFNTSGGSVFMAFTNDLSSVTALNYNPNVVFRIVGTGSPAAGGTMRVDNFTVSGASGYTFTTFAGSAGYGSTDGTGSAARFYVPIGIAVDGSGNTYVADLGNSTIRKVTPAGVVSTLAGLAGSIGSADGTGSAARFWDPEGVAVDSSGNVYVADYGNNKIRKVTPAGVVSTLAVLAGGFPNGVAVDGAGNVYVAGWDDTIRKVTPAGVVTTLGGLANSSGTADGTGSAALFYRPSVVAVDGAGNVYVADIERRKLNSTNADDRPRQQHYLTILTAVWATDGHEVAHWRRPSSCKIKFAM